MKERLGDEEVPLLKDGILQDGVRAAKGEPPPNLSSERVFVESNEKKKKKAQGTGDPELDKNPRQPKYRSPSALVQARIKNKM